MPTPLSTPDILNLISILRNAFKAALIQRDSHLLAKHIQLPKIPSILSEAIIASLIEKKRILNELHVIELSSNHGLADIVARTKDRVIKIEVKSTGESAFQQLGEKDIKADVLVWLHFDRFFIDEKVNSFEVFIIHNPAHRLTAGKITLSNLRALLPDLEPEVFTIREI